MTRVRVEGFTISLDGHGAGPNQDIRNPLGVGGQICTSPAIEGPLGKSWYRKGKRHREDGPAVEHADGRKGWYRHGKELTAAEFAAIREKELAEIGDAFKTGLTSEMTVSRPRPRKNSPAKPKT